MVLLLGSSSLRLEERLCRAKQDSRSHGPAKRSDAAALLIVEARRRAAARDRL
jgi:hypothetical protein